MPAAKKQIPSKIKTEAEVEVGEDQEDKFAVETEKPSNWQVIEYLSDKTTRIECVNMIDVSGMGKRNCIMRMVDPETDRMAGIPIILPEHTVVNGVLQG